MISSSRSRADACSASLTRTATCGLATRCRKQSEASAVISASGSRAIRAGTSFLLTATATSTASVSSRASTAERLRSSPCSKPAMRSSVAAALCSAVVCASAKPRAWAASSACATLEACSVSEMVGLLLRPPASKSLSNRNFAGADPITLSSIDQLFVAAALRDHDLALGGEVLGQADQLPLRVVDVAQAHRPHGAHVVAQHLGGARGHVAQEELADRLGCTLEGDRELVLVDVPHQGLRRAGIKLDEIVEREHQILDALGALAALLLERRHEERFVLPIERVENLRHLLVGITPAGLREARHELGAQRLLHPLDHFFLHGLHPQHTTDDVERELARQDGEHARGMLWPELAQNHRDGLRGFVLELVA